MFFFQGFKITFFKGKNEALPCVFKLLHVCILDASFLWKDLTVSDSTVNGSAHLTFSLSYLPNNLV